MTEIQEKLTKAEEREFAKELVAKIGELAASTGRKLRFMEVCGTHTVAIFRAGLRQILPDSVELVSGPEEEAGEQQMVTGPAGIRISGLTFRYDDGDRDVIHGLDFDFPPSSRTAIVGETGIGKSTLVRLMLSVLKPTKGDIEIYGNGAYFAASPMTRCNIVYVPQGNTLFSGTIRENLRLGDPDATEDRMRWALETAEAGFVFDLPDGLDTICGEKGAGLSEGQAQRIAIARGLLRPGSILLMDEFSSSLDPETEARLVTNLYESTAGKTLIFITHREQVVSRCDRVLNLEEMG